MQLNFLNDDELLRHAHLQLDSLTSTPLEQELIKRLEKLIGADGLHAQLSNDFGIDADNATDMARLTSALQFAEHFDLKNVRALLDVLTEHDIDDPAALRKSLQAHAEFEDLMQDLAAPIARLHALSHPATTPTAKEA